MVSHVFLSRSVLRRGTEEDLHANSEARTALTRFKAVITRHTVRLSPTIIPTPPHRREKLESWRWEIGDGEHAEETFRVNPLNRAEQRMCVRVLPFWVQAAAKWSRGRRTCCTVDEPRRSRNGSGEKGKGTESIQRSGDDRSGRGGRGRKKIA